MRKFKTHRLIKWTYTKSSDHYNHYIRTWWFWGLFYTTRVNSFRLKVPKKKHVLWFKKWDDLIKQKKNL